MSDNTRIEKLEKELEEIKIKLNKEEKKEKKEKKPRQPTEYNKFVKEHLASMKQSEGDKYDHKKAFKSASEAWRSKK
tara:strand:+ start:69 stop:299 length:231 start_codon:yes stop_codon:yes gene_type:complete